jgi:hypothetical protein
MAAPRRFPRAPWRVEKYPAANVVRDANGQALAYLYSRATDTDAMQAKVLNMSTKCHCRVFVRESDAVVA